MPTACRSIEKRYVRVSPEWSETYRVKPNPDVEQAVKVQEIWESLDFLPKKVLCAEYPQRQRGGVRVASKKLGISEASYLMSLSKACRAVMLRLEG